VQSRLSSASQAELSAGYAIQVGMQAGLRTEGVLVSDAPYVDVGTPDGLNRALRQGLSTH
jgi:hypothetical protein